MAIGCPLYIQNDLFFIDYEIHQGIHNSSMDVCRIYEKLA